MEKSVSFSASLVLMFAMAHAACGQTRRGASLAEQKMCSEQAQRFQNAETMMVVNHYDKARNVCFVRTWAMLHDPKDHTKYIGSSYELQDAFEGFSYGSCMTDADDKILDCWAMQPPNKGKKAFLTTDAWLIYVNKTYMSD